MQVRGPTGKSCASADSVAHHRARPHPLRRRSSARPAAASRTRPAWRTRGRLAALVRAAGRARRGAARRSPRVTRRRSWSGSRLPPGWRSWTDASGPRRRAPGRSSPVDADGQVGAPVRVGGAPARIAAGANGLWVTDAATGRVVPVEVPPPAPPSAAVAGPTRLRAARRGRGRQRRRARGRRAVGREHRRSPGLRARARRRDEQDRRRRRAGRARRRRAPRRRGRRAGRVDLGHRRAPARVRRPGPRRRHAGGRRARRRRRLGGGRRGRRGWCASTSARCGSRTRWRSAAARSRSPRAGDDLYVLVAGDRELVKVTDGVVQWRRGLPAPPTALAVDARHVWVGAGQLLRYER